MSEEQSSNLSRRDFGKLGLGLGLASISSVLTMSEAEAAEAKAQEIRKKYKIKNSPIKIDESKFKLFSPSNDAFSQYEVKNGVPWVVPFLDSMARDSHLGKYHKDIPAASKGDARAASAMSDAAGTIWKMTGYGTPNRGFLKWNPMLMHPSFIPEWGGKAPYESNPTKLAHQTKMAARLYGADLVGIAPLNRRWIYSDSTIPKIDVPILQQTGEEEYVTKNLVFKDVPHPQETETEMIVPEKVNNVIVMAVQVNREMMQTAPSRMNDIPHDLGYSRMYSIDIMLAEFIRGLGYNAIPCGNGVGLTVPMAVEAGLGQAGRHGVLVTPEYGSAIRLCKVLTDMPMDHDSPIDFGVTEFCETCKKCARECPSKTITEGSQSFKTRNVCNQPGVLKWQNDYPKCFNYWLEAGSGCGVCVAVCPFTKGAMWGHKGVEWIIDNMRFMDPIMLGLDDAFGYAERRDEEEIWSAGMSTYGLDIDHLKNSKYKPEKKHEDM